MSASFAARGASRHTRDGALDPVHARARPRRTDSVIDDPQAVEPARADRLPLRAALRRAARGPVAGAAGSRLRRRGRRASSRRTRRDGRGARRGSGDGLLARRQRARDWLSVELPEMAALRRELLPEAPNLRLDRGLGARRGLDGRGRRLARRAADRPGAAHVLHPGPGPRPDRCLPPALPRRRPDLRRDPALAVTSAASAVA